MTETDCVDLGEEYVCDRGLCRQPSGECEPDDFSNEDFVLLGDNFLANSGMIALQLTELLQSTGALSEGKTLRDYSSSIVSPFGGGEDLSVQYAAAQNDGPSRVVVMDAGGPDALLDCDTSTPQLCPTLQNAVDGTEALLAAMAEDGVARVVLFFYPRPDEADLAVKFEILESELFIVCTASQLECSFVSLAPLFEGHRSEWLMGQGLFPTEAGAEVTSGALFGAMQAACILP